MYESQTKLKFCGDNGIPNHPLANNDNKTKKIYDIY